MNKIRKGDIIEPPKGTEFKIVEVDEDNKQYLLEFKLEGVVCRVWTSEWRLKDSFELKREN